MQPPYGFFLANLGSTASRFAGLDRPRAIAVALILALLVLASIGGAWTAKVAAPSAQPIAEAVAKPKGQGNEDLALYRSITQRVAAGENYYRAAADELRRGNYPLRPFVTFRLPTLAMLGAWIGRPGMLALQYLLFAAMIASWWKRLDGQFADNRRRVSGTMLAAAGIAVALAGRYFYLHEVWAGTLIALSLALHRRDRWGWSVAAAALALSIRELALPYLLLMATMALYRRNWRELAAWSGVILVFALLIAWHAAQVSQVILPTDPPSPGWTSLGGYSGLLRTYYLSGPLRWLPSELAAPLILLTWVGWISWKSDTGLTASLAFAGYGLGFALFGRSNNFYWGLMVAPAFLVGIAFLPRALADLRASARRSVAAE